jgi:hypothetical protein
VKEGLGAADVLLVVVVVVVVARVVEVLAGGGVVMTGPPPEVVVTLVAGFPGRPGTPKQAPNSLRQPAPQNSIEEPHQKN